ncbi:SAM-dependent methyltransferase [Corynebacterium sp. 13CS0277]|uniref:THUMP-like domain-containing protein n=1 Tax=Corynebacterium sp. 13CS0277 TaxID=2071994 RepID=UPI000D03168A|nr:SAM-dependent methyltransferase [Corynebacterium sp. 13CS0277]PRQ10731.1 SAM-dependent methyltransferase [Corynebacterium sp. 13CS0277]
MSYTPQEVRYLAAHARDITDAASEVSFARGDALARTTALAQRFGTHSRAVAELLSARHKATGKLPSSWLMCTDSSQQATPLAVAQQRAARIRQACGDETIVHDVTCSIGTDAAALAAAGLPTIATDIDPARALMAHHNLRAGIPGAPATAPWLVGVADALQPVTAAGEARVIVADPARRAGGRRIARPEDLIPPLPSVMDTYAGRELAIKCAPGLDFDFWDGLVSVTSLGGGVKEACLYTPGLAGGARREAVVLRDSGGDAGLWRDVFTDQDPDDCTVGDVGDYLIDPDGAIVRAGLVTHFATRYGLQQIDERIAYLTGAAVPPGYSGFPVLEVTTPKKVKAAVSHYGFGRLEILLRGIAGDPDALRKSYKPKGNAAGAVVLTRVGSRGVAIICGERVHAPRD